MRRLDRQLGNETVEGQMRECMKLSTHIRCLRQREVKLRARS
jgi:hypothetical protein